MNLSQLHSFLYVAETASFTEAARRLNLSQPAISRQMASLEQEVGTMLFSREHNTIALTVAGKHLQEELRILFPKLQLMLEETKRIGEGEKGRLRIGLLEDQSLDQTISGALRRLKQENIHLSIQRLNFQTLEDKLTKGEIDVAISIEQSPYAFPGCSRTIYAVESMCLAVHRDYLPGGEISSGEDLQHLQCPLLVPSLDSFQRSQYDALASLIKNDLAGSQEYDFSSIAPMVAAGLAATLANESHNLSVDQSVTMVPLRDLPGVSKGIFYPENNRNPVIRTLEKSLENAQN